MKIMVIGCCGAGKSTFSKILQQKTSLPLIHLDQCYWKPNWTTTPKEEWEAIVEELANRKEWIIDGNYNSTLDIRLEKADTVIYLDLPTWKCLWRVIKRIYQNKGRSRSDMTENCEERWDWEFILFVATFNLKRRKKLLHKINSHQKEKKIIILKNQKAIDQYLNSI